MAISGVSKAPERASLETHHDEGATEQRDGKIIAVRDDC